MNTRNTSILGIQGQSTEVALTHTVWTDTYSKTRIAEVKSKIDKYWWLMINADELYFVIIVFYQIVRLYS